MNESGKDGIYGEGAEGRRWKTAAGRSDDVVDESGWRERDVITPLTDPLHTTATTHTHTHHSDHRDRSRERERLKLWDQML